MSESSLKRSSSERVSQIFDNFMTNIIPPRGKENIMNRSNYHKSFHEQKSINRTNNSFISNASPKRDNSSVLVIKALQNKITEIEKDKDIKTKELQSIEEKYKKLENDHKEMIPILQKYQSDIMNMKDMKDKKIVEMTHKLDEQLQYLKRENLKNQELQKEIDQRNQDLDSCMSDLKKERQMNQKLKQEYRIQQDKNDEEFEQQIEFYRNSNSQLQSKLQKMGQEYQVKNDECQELKSLYEDQLKYIENDVKSIIEDYKQEIEGLKEQLFAEQESNKELKEKNNELEGHINSISCQFKIINEDSQHKEQQSEQQCQQTSVSSINQRQYEYQELMSEIIEVEKVAFQLNCQYQELYRQFSQEQENREEIKEQMNLLMEKIKINNTRLYDLKTQEFYLISQNEI